MNRLKLSEKLSYGIADLGFNLSFNMVAIFLIRYYTDVLGISAAVAGTIFFIPVVWDAISDPLMGWFSNRFQSRHGRYRPFLLIAALPIAIAFIAMFYKPSLTGNALIFYAIVCHLLYRTFFTVGNIPYAALATEMTSSTNERTRLAAFRMFSAMAGTMIIGTIAFDLVKYLGEGDLSKGYFLLASLAAGIATILFVISFLGTKERPQPTSTSKETLKLGLAWKMLLVNRPFWLLFFFILVGMGMTILLYQTLNFYFAYYLESESNFRWAWMVLQGLSMGSIPLWSMLARVWEKRETLLAACVLAIFGAILLAFANKDFTLIYIALGFIGSGIGCAAFLFWAMIPDTVEYGEYRSDIRAEGVVAGLGLFALKFSTALGGWLMGMILSLINYVPNESQSQATLDALRTTLWLGPVIGFSLIFIIMLNYPLSKKQFRLILEKLNTGSKS